ncbi:protein kinase domain-containing protein [Bacteroides sp.]
MNIYIKKSLNAPFESIVLPDKELGKGGQARVYTITTAAYKDYCVKIFIKPEDATKNYDRIQYMVQNPPNGIMDNSGFRICWPVAFAYDTNKQFIGYMMPLAFPKSRDLKILETYSAKPFSVRFKNYPEWHNKYELTEKSGIENRIKMLCNWAIAIHCIHATQRYVIIDLKPENVMATATGKISIVDTDSFQISENGKLLFPGSAYTPAYFPPEGKSYQQNKRPFPPTCDYFAAAIVFYRILTGVHPYGGTKLSPPYDNLETEEECISEGLFAYGSKQRFISFPANFNLHANFSNIPSEIQRLFIRAFDSDINNRPPMAEWGQAFKRAIDGDSVQIKTITKPVNTHSPSIKITGVSYANLDDQSQCLQKFGEQLYTDITYLTPCIQYQVLKQGAPIELWYKIYTPNGDLHSNSSSKPGYTWNGTVECGPSSTTAVLNGWGSAAKTSYKLPGTWKIDFYEGDICLYKSTLNILERKAQTTPSKTSQQKQKKPTQPKAPTQPTSTDTGKTKRMLIWGAAIVAVLFCAYQFLYKPMTADKNAPDTYAQTENIVPSDDAVPERETKSESASKQKPAAVAAAQAPITIQKINFGNFDSKGNSIGSGNLRANSLQYLKGEMQYLPNKSNTSVILYIKLYRPNGELVTGKVSRGGYTINTKLITPNDTENIASHMLPGWGNKACTVYSPGVYKYEIWYDNKMIYSTKIEIG